MFPRMLKPYAEFNWMFMSSKTKKVIPSENVDQEANNPISLSENETDYTCLSMDSVAEACLATFSINAAWVSTDSREYCTGRSLYNSTNNMDGFYNHLKKVQNGNVLKKSLGRVLPAEKPTLMAELLAAQISTMDVSKKEKHSIGVVKGFFGKWFNRLINKKSISRTDNYC